ncbi:MAG: two-component regulator propeller domain-containing protein [Spirosomataceae bacterium]
MNAPLQSAGLSRIYSVLPGRNWVSSGFVIFLLISALKAQQLPFRNYSLRDGLLSNTVYVFFQDRAGYLWAATDGGLSRFDGKHFTNYERTRDGIPLGIILSFAQTANGRIWVGGNGSGLFAFDGKEFVHHKVGETPGSNLVTALCETEPNVLFIGTEKGLYLEKKGRIRPLVANAKMIRSFKYSASGDAYKMADGRLRILTDGEMRYLDPKTGVLSSPLKHPHPQDHFDWTALLSDGRLVIGCVEQHRIYIFKKDSLLQTLHLPRWRSGYAFEDGRNQLWIATDKGFLKTDFARPAAAEEELLTSQTDLPFTNAGTAFADREHHLWFGSYGKGIYKPEEPETVRFPYPFAAGLGAADERGRLWFSTPAGLRVVGRKANGTFFQQRIRPMTDRYYKSMGAVKTLSGNQLWLGSDDGHLGNFQIEEQKDGSLSLHFLREIGPRTGFVKIKPAWLFVDSKGRLWCSEMGKPALYVVDIASKRPSVIQKIPFDPGNRLSNGRFVMEDTKGNFWFAYERSKVLVFDPDLQPIPHPQNLPAENRSDVSSVHQDKEGAIWFGTDTEGLFRRTVSGALRHITKSDGLLSDRIIHIKEGPNQTLWMATWQGLAFLKYQGDSLQFDEKRELTESPIWSLGLLSEGLGWLATNYEVVFHRRAEKTQVLKPGIVLNSVSVNGQPVAVDEKDRQLSANENNVVFEFGSVYFQNRESLRFRWKLAGSNRNKWSNPVVDESVNFAQLKPGKYEFWVKAVTSDGTESPQPARFAFTIVPPLWERWWFITFGLLVLVGTVWVILNHRIKRLLEIERLRARIAADLHDDIGSGLTRIALTSEMLLRQKKEENPNAHLPLLQRIGNTSRELIEAMSDIVWSIDPQNDTLAKVAERIRIFANDLCDSGNIECSFTYQAGPSVTTRKLGSDIVSSLVLIAKEALNNAVRHAQCTRLTVHIEASSSQLRLRITDDGIGFVMSELPRINGLTNMRRRAEKSGGKLEIISGPNKGTKVYVEFPGP